MKKSISSVFLSATKKSLLFLAIVMAAVMLCAAAPALDQSENGLRTKAYAYTGWDEDGSYWYYYNDDIPASGWQEIYHNGQWDWYYFIDGCMQTGWLDWDGSWFYLRDSYGQNVGFISATILLADLIPTGSIAMDILIIYVAARLVRATTAPITEQ